VKTKIETFWVSVG